MPAASGHLDELQVHVASSSPAVKADGEEGGTGQLNLLHRVSAGVVVTALLDHRGQRHFLHELTGCVGDGHQAAQVTVLYHLLHNLQEITQHSYLALSCNVKVL